MEFFTIGVFNSTEDAFFNKLISNGIDTFCDIRQRRGVRGAKYSFVNSNKLQQKLEKIHINYLHILALAPTTQIRELQKLADARNGESKTTRHKLGQTFALEYGNKILGNFDFAQFFQRLENLGSKRVALFCVEEHPEACHRSIVARQLREAFNYRVTNL